MTGISRGDPLLGQLGVGSEAERLYGLLLRAGSAPLTELAARLDLEVGRVAELAGQLREAGLIAAIAGEETSFAPVDPRVAVRALSDRRQEQLDAVRGQIPLLAELFDNATNATAGSGATVVLSDPDAVAATYVRLQQHARHQFLAFDRPPYVTASQNPLQPALLGRGVRWRAVYAAASFETPGSWQEAIELGRMGEQGRVVDHLPVKLAVADHDLALVSLRLDAFRGEALRTEAPSLIDALCDLFEMYWERGAPVAGSEPSSALDEPDAVVGERRRATASSRRTPTVDEQSLLSLISAGLKDEVIARQLGISSRTLRRRTQDLLTELGAANRFQAGAEAARRGWI